MKPPSGTHLYGSSNVLAQVGDRGPSLAVTRRVPAFSGNFLTEWSPPRTFPAAASHRQNRLSLTVGGRRGSPSAKGAVSPFGSSATSSARLRPDDSAVSSGNDN